MKKDLLTIRDLESDDLMALSGGVGSISDQIDQIVNAADQLQVLLQGAGECLIDDVQVSVGGVKM